MRTKRPYKRQYLWVSQDFYNWIMDSSEKARSKGVETGSALLTHKLVNDFKLPEKVNFDFQVNIKRKQIRRKR